jgi:hypothetical protein
MVINIIKVLVALVPAIITTMSNRDKENRWKTSFTILAIIVLGIAIECLISWIYSEIVIGYTFMDNLIFSHIMVGLVMFIAAAMYSIAYREKIEKKEIVKNLGGMLAVFVIWFLVSIDFSKDAQANSKDLMINIPIWISQALCCISHCNLFLNLLSLANKKD